MRAAFERVCLITYHEIGLKGRNRSNFERRLQSNVEAALVGCPVGRVQRVSGRLAVRVAEPDSAFEVAERIAALPGVGGVSVGYKTSREMADLERASLLTLQEAGPYRTFRIEARRSNTDFAIGSQELNRLLGAYIQSQTSAPVDLDNPDATVHVQVVQGEAYVFSARVKGIGGLPVGTASRVVSLLSSGIDSPVATWRLIRRGAVTVGLHFSGRPQVSDSSERLVAEIGRVLEHTGGLGRIYVVPFGDIQREVSLLAPPDLRVLIYRRLMIRVAEGVARVERAKAIVTGESLGQVASQTLENIAAVDEAATLPVLRPLIGSDKLEIMDEARRIGTYELSIQAAEDCCTLFMPRNPETHAKLPMVLEAWDALPHERMVADALAAIEWVDFACPAYRPPRRWPTMAGEPGGRAIDLPVGERA
ncbi:MAG: tRNA 4-thiouridine(8) synthase ThiI [Actinobacteria bacterium]|nr:MAG: tRNA 4-thiouridine(8) synthase ThiI [Actinomycetota bacterium]